MAARVWSLLWVALLPALLVAGGARADQDAPVAFGNLPGLASDDLIAAFRTFRTSCASPTPVRPAVAAPPGLKVACRDAKGLSPGGDRAVVRAFFERRFEARRITTDAFFTGYYEPVVAGSLARTAAFATPLYARPRDLVTVAPGKTRGLDPALNAARRLPDGSLAALPDRAGIEAGALGRAARPLVYVESPVDAFFIQVQGSARIQLSDGRLKRLVFDGRNGFPYTSIGKLLVQRLGIPPADMGLAQLRAWIREHGQQPGEEGLKLMQENRSFIFFRFDDVLPSNAGPIGGAGVSLTPLRSIAIDKSHWPYGLPFFIDTALPDGAAFRHLMVAQDTGAAIIGRGRADIFFGSGEEAARRAGPVRQTGTLYVLWPKEPGGKTRDKTAGEGRGDR